MGDWQPIETAPRDGKHILACEAGVHYPEVIYFGDGIKRPAIWIGASGSYCIGFEPTHWMPLPAPPAK